MGANGNRSRDELEAESRATLEGAISPPEPAGVPILPLPALPTLGYHVDEHGRKVAVVMAVHTHYGVQVYTLPRELAHELGAALTDHAGEISTLEIARDLPPKG